MERRNILSVLRISRSARLNHDMRPAASYQNRVHTEVPAAHFGADKREDPQSVEAVFGGSPRVIYIKRGGRERHW